MKDLNLMITIVRRQDDEEFSAFFDKQGQPPAVSLHAKGAARSKTLSLLGIEESEKTVFLSLVSGDTARGLFKGLTRELYLDMPDRGIAITCPLSSIGANALATLVHGEINEKEGLDMNTEKELIVIIANRNATDLVIDAAREGGAVGGTVINAKGTASAGSATFMGITIAAEKEVILIVTKKEDRTPIMRSVVQNAGMNSPAEAVVFALPISDAAGFRNFEEIETL